MNKLRKAEIVAASILVVSLFVLFMNILSVSGNASYAGKAFSLNGLNGADNLGILVWLIVFVISAVALLTLQHFEK